MHALTSILGVLSAGLIDLSPIYLRRNRQLLSGRLSISKQTLD
ncbi:hypothetical protein SD78_2257 [Bacillus badius]|nr:hypothetical protein SD78_2257 [Bacillus badius]